MVDSLSAIYKRTAGALEVFAVDPQITAYSRTAGAAEVTAVRTLPANPSTVAQSGFGAVDTGLALGEFQDDGASQDRTTEGDTGQGDGVPVSDSARDHGNDDHPEADLDCERPGRMIEDLGGHE